MDDIYFLSFFFKDQEIIKRADMKQAFMAGYNIEDLEVLDKEEQLNQSVFKQHTRFLSVEWSTENNNMKW